MGCTVDANIKDTALCSATTPFSVGPSIGIPRGGGGGGGSGGGNGCDVSQQPSPQFTCVGGVWIANETISVPEIIISTPVVIIGDLDVNGPLTFSGASSSINITGCVKTTQVVIVIGPNDLPRTDSSRTLINQGGSNCTSDPSLFPLSVKQTGKSCKKVEAQTDKDKSSPTLLVVAFHINNMRCNLWWIILVAVVGGIILLAAIFIILATFYTPLKIKVRPFWLRSNNAK
jgi:hypothetical protein